MKGSSELVNEAKKKVIEIVNKKAVAEHGTNWAYIKDNVRDQIGQFLFNKTQRRPMVLPVVIEV